MGSLPAVIIFSVLAIAELIGDKLPTTPKRTALAPLLARIVSGGLCGACLCASGGQALSLGAILGGIGALIGAFCGYEIRRQLTSLGLKDFVFAIGEDIIAIGLAFFIVAR